MPSTFKNARAVATTSYATIYTCPAATTALVTMAQFANVDGTNVVDASAQWLDSSASNAATRLMRTVSVPAKSALVGFTKVVLEAGDALQVMASAATSCEVTISVLELS